MPPLPLGYWPFKSSKSSASESVSRKGSSGSSISKTSIRVLFGISGNSRKIAEAMRSRVIVSMSFLWLE